MEQRISIERMEQAVNLFGSFDENVRLIESEFKGHHFQSRGRAARERRGRGHDARREGTQRTAHDLDRGEPITEQNVRYVISLVRAGQEDRISELTQDVHLHQLQGPAPSSPRPSDRKNTSSPF